MCVCTGSVKGGVKPGGDEHQVQDTGDPAVHHGRQTGPPDHQSACHLQERVQDPGGTVLTVSKYVCACIHVHACVCMHMCIIQFCVPV